MATVLQALYALNQAIGIPGELIRERGLDPHAEADEVVLADTDGDREFLLTPAAAAAWQAMKAAALADDIEIFLVSAFRSMDRQIEIVRGKLQRGLSAEEILAVSAPPGFSEHHTGRAIDVGTPGSAVLEEEFETTPAYAWLVVHAGEHGYTLSYPRGNAAGYQYEPWHWCHGAPAAGTEATLTA